MLKVIKDFDGYYICDDGYVYTDIRQGCRDKSKRSPFCKRLNPRLTKNGYARVYLRNSVTNKRQDLYIHRLVAQEFIPNPENKKYVNHKNFIRNCNQVDNLEWATAKENVEYSMNVNHILRDDKGRFVSNYKYGT